MSQDSVINLCAAFTHRMFSLKSTVTSFPTSHHHFTRKTHRQAFLFSFFSFSSYVPRVGTTLWHVYKLWWETKWTTCCDCTVGRMCFISELLSQLLSLAQSGGFSRWQVCMTDITRPVPADTYVLTMYLWLHRRTQNKGFTFYQVRDVLTSKEAARKWFYHLVSRGGACEEIWDVRL